MSVYVQGKMPKGSKRFQVNFACSPEGKNNVLLHMSVLVKADAIVLGTVLDGRWGNMETHSMSLRNSEHFEVVFFVEAAKYQILVNRKLLGTFKHKLQPRRLRDIGVDDDLELQFLTVMGGQLMSNLVLPYYHSIPGGLQPGMSVYMQGIVLKNAKRFRVDFAHSRHKKTDIPFHFNPRFNVGKFVLNSFQARGWGHAISYEMLLQKGRYFEAIFIVTEDGYQVIVNKKPVCSFRHRTSPQRVQVIKTEGDLMLLSLTLTEGPVMENTILPYYHPVPGGLHPRMFVYMQGMVPKDSNRSWVNFNVDFACGQHKGAHVSLHFRPHITGKIVVLNALETGRWGKEEKHQNPLRKGEHFQIIFIVTMAGYQILVNGNHLCSFRHRMPPERVRGIRADGDLKLQSLMVMTGPTMGSMVSIGYRKMGIS
ncbi:galectin-6-like [Erythrolamprus reginae]|uniref:galectin-6-like n=1 Tax=Erythrolamprus reginae TaxID=121349 RepID=UPI00396CD58E